MNLLIQQQLEPDIQELKTFFEAVFSVYDAEDERGFSDLENPTLDEWFAIDRLPEYLQAGFLLETRTEEGQLVGAVFVAKQNSLTWPDGNKMEVFILGVDPKFRSQQVGQKLMIEAEKHGEEFGAKSLIVNTHESVHSVHRFYEKLGYKQMGTLREYYDNGDGVFFQKKL